nr:hypothetical protein [Sobelivirales sp.]
MPRKASKNVKSKDAQKKKPAQQPAQQFTVVRKQKTRPMGQNLGRYPSLVCSNTDPFCEAASGAKIPDSSSVRTLAYRNRRVFTLTTSAAGGGALLVTPNYVRESVCPMTLVTPPFIYAPTGNIANPDGISGADGFRIVTCGFIIRNITAPLNSSGMVYIRQLANSYPLTSDIDVVAYGSSKALDVSLQMCKEVAVVCSRSSQPITDFYDMTDPGVDQRTYKVQGFPALTVAVSGAPASTAVLQVEWFVNYEITFDESAAVGRLATPSIASIPLVDDAVKAFRSTAKTLFQEGVSAVTKYTEQRAMDKLKTLLLSRVGVPMLVD